MINGKVREEGSMQNFHYNIPTQIYFGKGQIEKLGANLKKLSDRVLLVYGGGSINRLRPGRRIL